MVSASAVEAATNARHLTLAMTPYDGDAHTTWADILL